MFSDTFFLAGRSAPLTGYLYGRTPIATHATPPALDQPGALPVSLASFKSALGLPTAYVEEDAALEDVLEEAHSAVEAHVRFAIRASAVVDSYDSAITPLVLSARPNAETVSVTVATVAGPLTDAAATERVGRRVFAHPGDAARTAALADLRAPVTAQYTATPVTAAEHGEIVVAVQKLAVHRYRTRARGEVADETDTTKMLQRMLQRARREDL